MTGVPPLRLTVLGQIAVEGADGSPRAVGTTAANLLAALATAPGHFLSIAGLAEDVWPDRPPQHPKAALQTVVSRLRAQSRRDLLRSTPGGYGVDLDGGAIDLGLAADLLAEAHSELRAGAAGTALGLCDEAERLWYGEPGTGVTNAALAAEIADRAATTRSRLARLRAEATLADGRPEEAVALLAPLTREAPFDDQLVLLTLRALSGAGRVSQAVETYAAFRARLADALGTDPAPEVAAFHEELLRQEDPLSPGRPRRTGVHAPTGTLYGRDQDVADAGALLREHRLVTVTGTGGIGKTRLAHAVAWRTEETLPAAVVVELAGTRTGEDVTRALAAALDVPAPPPDQADGPVPAAVRTDVCEALTEHPTLLVLDNCEHVAAPVAAWVETILAGAATTRVLATSRTALRVGGEHVLPLAPIPARDATGGPGPAAALFGARARAVRPGILLDDDAVVRLCERLEGIPLGIELAAARVRSLTVAEIDAALDDRFAILRTTDPASASRHRALRDVVAWSWALLTDRQQLLARRAATLPDGFDARAAAFLVESSRVELVDDLDALVAHSLVQAEEDLVTGTMRYRMYETIREFGELRAAESGDVEAARAGAARWARDLAATSVADAVGRSQRATLHRLTLEQENLRSVLAAALVVRDADTVVAAGAATAFAGLLRFDFGAVGAMVAAVANGARGHRTAPELAAVDLWFRCLALASSLVFDTPREAARALIELRRSLDQTASPGRAASAFARTMLAAGDPGRFAAEVAASAASPDPGTRRLGLLLTAYFAENAGDLAAADAAARAAHEIATREHDTWSAAYAAQLLAGVHAQGNRPAETARWVEAATTGFAVLGTPTAPLRPLARHAACAHLLSGELDEAAVLFGAFLDADHPAGDGELFGRAGLAEVALARASADGGVGGAAPAADVAGVLADYRAAFDDADWDRPSTVMWLVLLASSCVAWHVQTGHARADGLAALVHRLGAHVIAVHRGRPQITDEPLLGAVAGAAAGWAAARDEADPSLAAALLATMDALRSRQDTPALERERLRAAVRAAEVPDAGDPAGATSADGMLDLLEALVAAQAP